MTIRQQLADIEDRQLVYFRDEQIVYESIIEKEYPAINTTRICVLFDDHNGHWPDIISDYLAMERMSA